jgi:hypothetical protein
MRAFIREQQGSAPDTPLDRAQTLMYQAFDEPDEQQRVLIARQALAICPDCTDAYVLLAEHAHRRKEALSLYEQALAAGERALGPEGFAKAAGHFWMMLDTRPYMRARLGLALAVWRDGRRDEAIGHMQGLLQLNPNDNQGVRYTLAPCLLAEDRDADLATLLAQYPESSAFFSYARALLAFRKGGDTPEARELLDAARAANQHIPDYLTGREFPPDEEPDGYSPGQESEAISYIRANMVHWKSTPGAVAWLRARASAGKPEDAPRAKGPLSLVKKWLRDRLPQAEDVWQADFRPMPTWIRVAGSLVRPWLLLVVNHTEDLVLAHLIVEQEPSAALFWDTLVAAMQGPKAGEPHRPAAIQMLPGEVRESLRPHLDEIGVALHTTDDLEHLDFVFAGMGEHLGGPRRPGLLDAPGLGPEQVGIFYEAAAEFYRRAPWRKLGYEAAIRVECARFRGGPWYAVIMGQSGITAGVALYEDLGLLQGMWAETIDDEDSARRTVGPSVTYGEAWTVPTADVDAAQRYGWKVAQPDAYPDVLYKQRGMSRRPPLAWELELVEGCLRAFPDFVARRRQDDPTRETVTVRVASGELTLGLAWVVEDEG